MSTHLPPGPWIRTQFFFENSEREWSNVVWWKITGSIPSGTDIISVATDFDTMFNGVLPAMLPPTTIFLGTNCYLNNGTYTVDGTVYEETPGTAAGDPLPTEDSAIVTINSGIGTRKGVGRFFISGLAEDQAINSRLSTLGQTNMNAIKNAIAGLLTAGGVPVKAGVWSRSMNAVEANVFLNFSDLLGHITKRRPRR